MTHYGKKKKRLGYKNARNLGYKWLSEKLEIPLEETHIGMFDMETCNKVIKLCYPYANQIVKRNKERKRGKSMEKLKEYYENKGIKGDKMLDLLDLAEDLMEYNVHISQNGYATLYHATSKEKANKIIQEQMMFGLEDGLFFSTSPNNQINGYGDTVISVEVPLQKLILDDEFDTEQHYRLPVKPNHKIHLRAKLYK